VHSLLRHLHQAGLPVPEPLSLDERIERVRLLPGNAGQGSWPHQLEEAGVRSAGSLLRRTHDATRTWRSPPDATWSVPHGGGEVICHGDPQPANMTWNGGRATGLFDWDAARPSDPVGDVAYALEWFAPFETDATELARRGFLEPPQRRRRIDAVLDGYGWDGSFDIVEEVSRRQRQAIEEVIHLGEAGHEPHATWVRQGWPVRWRAKLDMTRSIADEVRAPGRS
jgi:Ser/Thr protein kinase RdoA (MazF antagonist)